MHFRRRDSTRVGATRDPARCAGSEESATTVGSNRPAGRTSGRSATGPSLSPRPPGRSSLRAPSSRGRAGRGGLRQRCRHLRRSARR
eukprot:4960821-Prymnesium_polylepis.1